MESPSKVPGLFLAAFCLLLLTGGGVGPVNDGRAMLGVAEALVVDGTLVLPTQHQPGYTVVSPEGEVHSKFGLGQSLLLVPGAWVGRVVSLGGGEAGDIAWIQWLALHAVPALLGAAAFVACVGFGTALGFSAVGAFMGAGMAVFATPAWVYFRSFYSEGALVVTVLFSLLFLARLETRGLGWREWGALGLVAGSAVLVKSSGALVLVGVVAYVILRSAPGARVLNAARVGLAAALPVATALAYNHLRTGDWMSNGYGEGIDAWGFSTPLLEGLWGLLTAPGKGALWFAPGAVLGLGVLVQWRRNPVAQLIAGLTAGFVGVAAMWWAWHGGECWGPRLILPALVPLACLSGALWDRGGLSRRVLLGVGVAGFAVQLLGVGIHWTDHYDRVPHETWAEIQHGLPPGEALPDAAQDNLDAIHGTWAQSAIPGHAWLLAEAMRGREGTTGNPWEGAADPVGRPLLVNWWPVHFASKGQMGALQWFFLLALGLAAGLQSMRVWRDLRGRSGEDSA